MKKKAIHSQRNVMIVRDPANSPAQAGFEEVLAPIEAARTRAIAAVNTVLINLYLVDWGVYEPENSRRWTGAGNRCSPGPIHPAPRAQCTRIFCAKSLADAPIL